MKSIEPCALPESALLRRYQEGGAYADCYVTEVEGTVSQPAFVEAFYTTALFKVERAILRLVVARPSTDVEARQLAEGEIGAFAAWRVEDRATDQLLLGDFTGSTKSWFMVVPAGNATTDPRTRLYFGSAVVPQADPTSGKQSMGFLFRSLLGFHRLYSRMLLKSARSRLLARGRAPAQ